MKRCAPWPFSPFEGGQGDDFNFYPIKEASEDKLQTNQIKKPIFLPIKEASTEKKRAGKKIKPLRFKIKKEHHNLMLLLCTKNWCGLRMFLLVGLIIGFHFFQLFLAVGKLGYDYIQNRHNKNTKQGCGQHTA